MYLLDDMLVFYLTKYCQIRCILLNNSQHRPNGSVINLELLYSGALQGSAVSYV